MGAGDKVHKDQRVEQAHPDCGRAIDPTTLGHDGQVTSDQPHTHERGGAQQQ